MTQLKIDGNIAQYQIDIIMSMLSSWNLDARVEATGNTVLNVKMSNTENPLPFSEGMWKDYDIDDKTLRAKAWGTDKARIQ
ncbi:MAG: hypothetical protein LBE91_01085 [Tannerella sp.]|jgi:hypothetical protein|nr:hypothetical protein [Tannerella sp.]